MYMSPTNYRNDFQLPTKLVPHRTADYVVIVPYMAGSNESLANLLYESHLFNVWCISLVAFIIARIFLRHCHSSLRSINELIYIPINTIGVSFGTTSADPTKSRPERIVILFVAISSIFTGMFCADILLQTFIASPLRPLINSLEDVEKFESLKYTSNMFVTVNLLDKS